MHPCQVSDGSRLMLYFDHENWGPTRHCCWLIKLREMPQWRMRFRRSHGRFLIHLHNHKVLLASHEKNYTVGRGATPLSVASRDRSSQRLPRRWCTSMSGRVCLLRSVAGIGKERRGGLNGHTVELMSSQMLRPSKGLFTASKGALVPSIVDRFVRLNRLDSLASRAAGGI